MSDGIPIQPAATTLCLRDGAEGLEVLLMRRTSKLVFYGGAWVFPGGRVDEVDVAGGDAFSETAARVAAVREAQEEASLQLDPQSLIPFSHWTTPPGQSRRFSTWFFVAHVPGKEVKVDRGEIEEYRWSTPHDALSARHAGEIELPPPTFVTLDWAKSFDSAAAAITNAKSSAITRYIPRPVRQPTGVVSIYEGDAGYERSDAETAGTRHRLWMLKEGWRYERTGNI